MGGRSEFLYDLRNRRIEKKSPDLATGPPQIWRWTYDANGNPLTQTDPVGTVSTHSYDVLNRRTATAFTTAPAGSPSGRTWSYDPNGNPTRISETRDGQTVALELTYDAFNRPTNLLDANGRAWTQTFDAADQRRTLTSTGVPAVHWNYDNAARNTQIIVEGAGTFDLGYDAADRNESISHPNGVQTTHQFDPAGRIADIHHARNGGTIARFQYQYDANGNRIHQIEENGGPAQTSTFAYDHSDRLTEITEPSRYTRYTLDGNSNRIRTDAGATAGSAAKRYESSFNARNEITQQREYNSAGTVIATTNFEFDPNGNIRRQSSATAQTEYRYDALDRLIEITPPTGPPASYRYGPSDVRIASLRAGEETRFHYDGERLILETNPLGNPQKHYAYTAAGLLNTALLGSTPQHRSAHLDAQTSPIAISAANGNLISRSHFDPFGVETPLLGNRDHRITHQGYWSEPELDPSAQLSAARLYLPALGIYPERDPVEGLANSPITFNPHLIGRSNPLRWVDPDGRAPVSGDWAALINAERDGSISRISNAKSAFSDAPWYHKPLIAVGITFDGVYGIATGISGGAVTGGDFAADVVIAGASGYFDTGEVGRASASRVLDAMDVGAAAAAGVKDDPLAALGRAAQAVIEPYVKSIAENDTASQLQIAPDLGGYVKRVLNAMAVNSPAGIAVNHEAMPADSQNCEECSGNGPVKSRLPAHHLEVGSFGDLSSRSVRDGMTPDHIPSHASNRQRLETQLGRELTAVEERELRNKGTCMMVHTCDHAEVSRTYAGRNTKERIKADAEDHRTSQELDFIPHRDRLEKMGIPVAQIEAAFERVRQRNQELWGEKDGH